VIIESILFSAGAGNRRTVLRSAIPTSLTVNGADASRRISSEISRRSLASRLAVVAEVAHANLGDQLRLAR